MDKEILDIYSDYLLSSFSYTTAAGLSGLLEGSPSHDRTTRFLSSNASTPAGLWLPAKPFVHQVQSPAAVLIFDDSIEEKPYTDENEIICRHWEHSKNRSAKGINFMTGLYHSSNVSLPVAFQLISKTEMVIDKKTGKNKRKSIMTKNEYFREMAADCVQNQLESAYILNDSWYASAENMVFVKNDMDKHFVMPLKDNRKTALTAEDKKQGRYVRASTVIPEPDSVRTICLEGVECPLLPARQVFTNEDGSTAVLYLAASDMRRGYENITTLYQKRWKVEEYHKSLKQNASLSKSPTRTVVTQTNHCFQLCMLLSNLKFLQ